MRDTTTQLILSEVSEYYTNKLAEHGQTPRGVDWNGAESQTLRFEQLCKIIDAEGRSFSINDLGCGYGALYEFLLNRYTSFNYAGFDISEDMIAAARQRHQNINNAKFVLTSIPDEVADYSVASGIFNVRLKRNDVEWKAYLFSTLDTLNNYSMSGFAFNCLTSYSDAHKMRDYLFYPDPCEIFDYCKRHYSLNVALLHDYGLYEFTILVRKF